MEGLRARGHEGWLACVPGGRPEAVARERGFDVVPVPMRSSLDLRAVLRLRAAIRRLGIELVHLHTGRANWLGGLAARAAGRPAVTTRRMDRRVARSWRTRVLYGSLVRRAAAISPAVRERLLAGGVPAERVRLIWSTVDPARVAARREREAVRAELGAPPEARVVLAVGALVERKGFAVLLDAFARLADREALLWIAGDGAGRGDLERAIADLGLGERARLLGRRESIGELRAAADVFAMPSRAEGLGVAALEAMAAGRPVVASSVGGLADVVLDGETGALVPVGDVAALGAALDALLADAERRARQGRAGAARARGQFGPEGMVDAYEELYREVLAEASTEVPAGEGAS
jgi:glycosyltransferase involved in cell wall biosynthesis